MTARYKDHPEETIDTGDEPTAEQRPDRYAFALRAGGVVVLLIAWAITSAQDPTAANLLVNGVAVGGLGAYALVAAFLSRRMYIEVEKKLRLDLLVHNIELENNASRDDLTGILNRKAFFARLESELQTAVESQRPLSILLADIDRLKDINALWGHRTGDRILTQFSNFLIGHIRASDIPGRLGGDEFAVILPDTPEHATAIMISRIQNVLDSTYLINDGELTLRLTAALGASGFPASGDTVDAIMQKADAALRANKQARKEAAEEGDSAATEVPALYRKTAGTADGEEPA